jgi:hypothetical protein
MVAVLEVTRIAVERAVAPDRGRITVLQSLTSHQRPQQVNLVVRQQEKGDGS